MANDHQSSTKLSGVNTIDTNSKSAHFSSVKYEIEYRMSAEDLPYRVDYAKSNHAACQACRSNIAKDVLRIAAVVQSPFHDGQISKWYHFECFFPKQRPKSTAEFANFDNIRWEDQQAVAKQLATQAPPTGKREQNRADTSAGAGGKLPGFEALAEGDQRATKESLAEIQQEDIPAVKKLRSESVDVDEENQRKRQNEDLFQIRDKLSKLPRDDLVSLFEENQCDIPSGRANMLDALADLMTFGSLSSCDKCQGQFVYKSGLGYKCTGNLTVWSRCEEVTQNPKRSKFVVPTDLKEKYPFLEEYESQVKRRLIKVTAPTTSSAVKEEDQLVGGPRKTEEKSIAAESESKGTRQKLRVKDGGVVDPDSKLEDKAHVYQSGRDKYTATLGMADIQSKKNSYYKLQVLEADTRDEYWLFRSWGRIGPHGGGSKLESLPLEECIELFERLYHDKSGNAWESRDDFGKVPTKMYPIYVDWGETSDAAKRLLELGMKSELKQPVQDLIELIFDVDTMQQVMLEFEIDLVKMPLGKLSRRQIEEAYSVLSELQVAIEDRARLVDVSNRFYTLVPHDVGVSNPPILQTEAQIRAKCEMLESLLEIEIAYNLLYKSPLNDHYAQLNAEIDVLDNNTEEFQLIKRYMENTHATRSRYRLEIDEVFVVKRRGEEERYEPFMKLGNRKLLWHGSRTTNYAGILSQGLKIAPPEAPPSGYLFGKGIYFADMVAKSARYCRTKRQSPTGLLLLWEVALGDMYERHEPDYIEQLPEGKHSTIALGKTCPDPEESHATEDGVQVPLGQGVPARLSKKSSLSYNEYIVYDVAQVRVRYLVKTNFKFN